MQFIIAFFIFLIVINIIGFIFSFLWPVILALIVVVAILNFIAYRKRKKAMEEFYNDVNEAYREQNDYDFFDRNQTASSDDVIDVEFTETDADEDR